MEKQRVCSTDYIYGSNDNDISIGHTLNNESNFSFLKYKPFLQLLFGFITIFLCIIYVGSQQVKKPIPQISYGAIFKKHFNNLTSVVKKSLPGPISSQMYRVALTCKGSNTMCAQGSQLLTAPLHTVSTIWQFILQVPTLSCLLTVIPELLIQESTNGRTILTVMRS